jgi:hypothetical protein
MAAFLRLAPPALVAALIGGVELFDADLFEWDLVDGVTKLYMTNWSKDLSSGGNLYSSKAPWLSKTKWSVNNTAEISELDVKLSALNAGFNGGAQIKTQIHNGFFDGCVCKVSRVFMLTPGDATSLGDVPYFVGDVGGIDLDGITADIKVRSKLDRLDMLTPRNFFKTSCLHGFCDALCTLARATYTTTDAVGSSPPATRSFIPWTSVPADPSKYLQGTIAFTSGQNTGARRNIVNSTSSGVTPVYPFYYTPQVGDTFTRFEGCTKNEDDGSTHDCTARSNTQHYRGFRWTPPPNSAY